MDWNKFAEEVHANAVSHGWWDEDRDKYEIVALIHSEWSEALEEYREGRPMVWYGEDGKPEGIAVELMDGVIRILDYFAERKCPVPDDTDDNIDRISMGSVNVKLPTLVTILHGYTCRLTEQHPHPLDNHMWLRQALIYACAWVDAHGIDYKILLMEKHEYNKTRPYKHGGKLC